jgi:hypothetical protein
MRCLSRRKLASAAGTTAIVLALGGPARAQEPDVRFYGDAGTSEVSLQLGFGSNYFAGGAGLRYFVIDGLAPGLEASYQRSHGVDQGLVLGSLRLAPLRFGTIVPVITGRGGRIFLSDHKDGWAVGGDVGILLLASPNVAFELGYGFLRYLPESFCDDFVSCTIHQPVFGIRVTF